MGGLARAQSHQAVLLVQASLPAGYTRSFHSYCCVK